MADQSYHDNSEPVRAKRPKTGGRVAGTPNKATTARRFIAAGLLIPAPTPPKPKPVLLAGMKRCGCCREIRAIGDYFRAKRNGRARTRYCQFCTSAKRAKHMQRTDAGRAAASAFARHQNYGLSVEQFAAMLIEQAGLCKVCGTPLGPQPRQLQVDHCHSTGAVRSLLCRACNSTLGHSGDSAARMRLLAAYLDAF